MSFYRNFQLYSAFFEPSAEMRTSIDALARLRVRKSGLRHGAPRRVLDPACGPALWLEHFAARGSMVAGVELDANVAEAGRVRLAARKHADALVVAGDMRHPPTDIRGPFDLAINLDNSIGHLGGLDDVRAHLKAMHALLGTHGVYFLGCAVREDDDEVVPSTVYERGPLPIDGGGFAAIRSETLGLFDDLAPDGLRCERMCHHVLTANVEGVAPLFIEQYDLLTFPYATLKELLADGGPWEVLDCRDATDERLPTKRFAKSCGDVLLVLRPTTPRRAKATSATGRRDRTRRA
ncbi:MAG: class I SAM-dependent methyltransferase [Phycisphaerales bacterium]